MDDRRQENPGLNEAASIKKPYSPPRLTVHGSVQKITQLLAKGASDGMTGTSVL